MAEPKLGDSALSFLADEIWSPVFESVQAARKAEAQSAEIERRAENCVPLVIKEVRGWQGVRQCSGTLSGRYALA